MLFRSLLGAGTRISGGWELSGLTLPSNYQIRASALTVSGYNAGSGSLLQTTETFPYDAPTLVVEQPTSSPLASGSSSVAFGNVVTGLSSSAFTFTVKNTGLGDLKRLLLSIDGANAGDFALTTLPVSSLAPSGSSTFSIVFKPSARNSRTANLHIASSDPTIASSFDITLTGTGAPSPDANLASLTLSPGTLAPSFASGTTSYSAAAIYNTTSVTVTPTPVNSVSAQTVNGTAVNGGAASAPIALTTGANTITIVVTAEDGTTTKTYTLTVNRAAAPVPGDPDELFKFTSDAPIFTSVLQADGRLLVGGQFALFDGVFHYGLVRIDADGALESFNPLPPGSRVFSAVALPNGKLLLAGAFGSWVGATGMPLVNSVVLLNADGTRDATFDPVTNGAINCMALQPDGKILIGGAFSTVKPGAGSELTRNHLARLNTNGTVDTSFNPNANDDVNCLVLQPDGKVVVGGKFTNIAGVTRSYLVRLSGSNGLLDSAFNPSLDYLVDTAAVQVDGKVLIGGGFATVGGDPHLHVARVSGADGSVDTSFVGAVDQEVLSLALQTDGKLFVSGYAFATATGGTRTGLARLNSDGTLDSSFIDAQMAGPSSSAATVSSVMLQGNGRAVIGGSFVQLGGMPFTNLGRIEVGTASNSITPVGANAIEWMRGGDLPEAVSASFELSSDAGSTWTPLVGTTSRITGGWQITGLTNLPLSGLIRASARTLTGLYAGSSALISYQAPFSLADPEIAVADPDNTDLTSGTATIDFGTLGASVAQTYTFKISNLGGQDLTGLKVTIDGTNKAMFTVVRTPTAPLESLDSTTFSVQAKVTGTGLKTATLHIGSNDADEASFDINLTATAATAVAPTATTLAATALTATGATLNGSVNANGSPRVVSFDFGTTTAYGSSVAGSPGTVSTSVAESVSATLSGLQPHTVYHYQVHAIGDLGVADGVDKTFTTGNNAPVAVADSIAVVAPSALLDVVANDTDADGDPLTVTAKSALTPTSAGTLTLSGGSLIFKPCHLQRRDLHLYSLRRGRRHLHRHGDAGERHADNNTG